jgi:predicted outer membrane lipoprotein
MEPTPLAITLLSILGTVIICMFGLLIAMMREMKKDLRCTKEAMSERVRISDCVKKNDDLWEGVKELQKTVWSGRHE